MKKLIDGKNIVYEYYTNENINYNHKALDDINISVVKGEYIGIIGHNGSGKSTLAKHFNALLKPKEGVMWIKGLDTKIENIEWKIRENVGVVFQNPDHQIIAPIVEEDIAFGAENLGLTCEEVLDRVNTALEQVDMKKYKKTLTNHLSGGQKQKIALAGILALKPTCIVLDEATSMLHTKARKEILDTLYKLNKKDKITIIHITHNMEEVIVADRIYVMQDGKMLMQDTPKKIFSQVDLLKQIKLNVPQITELANMINKEGLKLPQGILTVEEMVEALCLLELEN